MDEDVSKQVNLLVESIMASEVYQNYEEQKVNIRKFPHLKEQIDEYRRQNYQLQTTENADELFYKVDEFEMHFEHLLKEPAVEEYLNAEAAVCRMLQEVFDGIAEVVEFE